MLKLNSDFCENVPEPLLTVATRSDCIHVCGLVFGPMILFLGGQNVVFLRVIMYRFVFYHVSPVSVVKFIPFSCEMYAILFHADFFFFLVNNGKCMFI